MELLLGHLSPVPFLDAEEPRRLAGAVIGHVPRDEVSVEVRHAVPVHGEVQLRGAKLRFDRAGDGEHLPQVGRRVRVGELGGVGHVPPAPDDDGVSGLTHIATHQICVGDAAGEDSRVAVGLVRPALVAHRTALAGPPFLPVRVPGPRHRGNGSVPASYTRCPSWIRAASHNACARCVITPRAHAHWANNGATRRPSTAFAPGSTHSSRPCARGAARALFREGPSHGQGRRRAAGGGG